MKLSELVRKRKNNTQRAALSFTDPLISMETCQNHEQCAMNVVKKVVFLRAITYVLSLQTESELQV